MINRVLRRCSEGRPAGPASAAGGVLCALLLLSAAAWASPVAEVPYEHFFLVRGEPGTMRGTMRVLQVTAVHNAGTEALPSVRVTVPRGARLMEPPEGWGDVMPAEGGLVDGRPLRPGEVREYRLLYEMTMGARPLALGRALPYPVDEITLWVEAPVLELTGLGLIPAGEDTVAGQRFRVYRMASLAPHEAWQVVVRPVRSGEAELPDLSRRGDPLLALQAFLGRHGGVILLAAFAAAGGWAWRRARIGAAARGEPPSGELSAAVRRWEEEIVRLDVAFRAGDLPEEVYRPRREALLGKLLRAMDERTEVSMRKGAVTR